MAVEGETVTDSEEPTVKVAFSEDAEEYTEDPEDTGPPKDYLLISIAVLFVCFWVFPVGLIALVQSLRTRHHMSKGNLEEARELSSNTWIWCIVTGIMGGLVLLNIVVFLAVFL